MTKTHKIIIGVGLLLLIISVISFAKYRKNCAIKKAQLAGETEAEAAAAATPPAPVVAPTTEPTQLDIAMQVNQSTTDTADTSAQFGNGAISPAPTSPL